MIGVLRNITIAAFILLALVAVAANIKLPQGYGFFVVQSGSMEPAIPVASVVLTKPTADFAAPLPLPRFFKGDVITFSSGSSLVSHRVVKTVEKDGQFFYETKGDANQEADQTLVAEKSVVGKVKLTVPYLGRFVNFAKQPLGYFLMILIPALYVILSEIWVIVAELRRSRTKIPTAGLTLPIALIFAGSLYFVGGTAAFFSDTATSSGNIFQTAACFGEEGTVWAYSVESKSQGTKNDGSSVDVNRSDPTDALGIPDGTTNPVSGFYSLGFGGDITLKFEFPVKDGEGNDISIHEITGGRASYPIERVQVEVSDNGVDWYDIGEATSEPSGDGVVFLNISSNTSAPDSIQFVRITDETDSSIHASNADGYDLDAVDAVYGCQVE